MTRDDNAVAIEESEPGRWDVVYLSPHLDDVAFSSPAAVRERRASDDRVLEVALFSRAGDESSEEVRDRYERRRSEELRAARLGGWEVHFAGFVDAPFRAHAHSDFNEIVWGTSPRDDELERRLANCVAEVVERTGASELVGPLGVGRHIDHRLVHRATRRVARETGVETWAFEDRPYALVPEAVALRLGELGVPVDPDLEAFFDAFWETPYVAEHLTEEERRDCRRRYVELVEGIPDPSDSDAVEQPSTRRFEMEPNDAFWEVPLAHESQVEAFLGSVDAYREACRAYARRVGAETVYVERQWRLDGFPSGGRVPHDHT